MSLLEVRSIAGFAYGLGTRLEPMEFNWKTVGSETMTRLQDCSALHYAFRREHDRSISLFINYDAHALSCRTRKHRAANFWMRSERMRTGDKEQGVRFGQHHENDACHLDPIRCQWSEVETNVRTAIPLRTIRLDTRWIIHGMSQRHNDECRFTPKTYTMTTVLIHINACYSRNMDGGGKET